VRDNPRAGMLGELEKLLHVGMTQNEVLALLGEPDSKRDRVFTYNLGMHPYRIDNEYFNIDFDADGRLVRYWIEQA
jgi:outer membrane protein assembly factor BamE (lipoprotein component of BamABCDE complex)